MLTLRAAWGAAMRVLANLSAVSALWGVALAQPVGLYTEAGPARRSVDVSVSGAIESSLVPSAPIAFSREEGADGAALSMTLGYGRKFGPFVAALSVEGARSTVSENFDPVAATAIVNQTVQFCFPPPPFASPGPPCISGVSNSTRTFAETQTVGPSYEETWGGALRLETGFAWKQFEARARGGFALQRARINYSLPATDTVQGPVPSVVIFGAQPGLPAAAPLPNPVTLPAESGAFAETLDGWTVGGSLRYELGRPRLRSLRIWPRLGWRRRAPQECGDGR